MKVQLSGDEASFCAILQKQKNLPRRFLLSYIDQNESLSPNAREVARAIVDPSTTTDSDVLYVAECYRLWVESFPRRR